MLLLEALKKTSEEIGGSHGDEDADVGLLGCNAVWTYMQMPSLRMGFMHVRMKY
jgi:hypothetical protein